MDATRSQIQRRSNGSIDIDFYRARAGEARCETIRACVASVLARLRRPVPPRAEVVAAALAITLSLPRS